MNTQKKLDSFLNCKGNKDDSNLKTSKSTMAKCDFVPKNSTIINYEKILMENLL